MKKPAAFLSLTVLLTVGFLIAPSIVAQQESATAEQIDVPVLDQAAMQNMSREERLTYQKAYKARLEEIAATHGWSAELSRRAFVESTPRASLAGAADRGSRAPGGTNITYHSGALSAATQSSEMVGNRFDNALNTAGTSCCFPVPASGSITKVTVNMAGVGGTVAFFSMFDQVAGTNANPITSMTIPLITGSNTVTLSSALTYVGSSFLAGIWNFTAGTDAVNLATGTVGSQGFHAVQINDVAGTAFATIPMMNAAVAVSGPDLSTPVELKSFSVD